jgi:hypothetical protein
MPPQQRDNDDADQQQAMRRVASESDMSVAGDNAREYKVRKSGLIG